VSIVSRRAQIRIPLVATIVTLLFLSVLALTARSFVRNVTFADIDEELETLSVAIGSDLELQGLGGLQQRPLHAGVESNLLAFRLEHHSAVLLDHGRVLATAGYLATHATAGRAAAIAARPEGTFTGTEPFSLQGRLCRFRISQLSGAARGATLVMFRSIEPTLVTLQRLDLALLAIVLLGAGGSALITALAVRRALKPVEEVTAVAGSAEARDLSRRVEVRGGGEEVDRLARVINSLFDRLQRAFDSQRRLVSDAAHELKTPVAAIVAEAQEAMRSDTDDAHRRELLVSIESSARALARETDDLLILARGAVDASAYTRFNVATVVEGVIRASHAPVEMRSEGDVELVGDSRAVERLISNLINNAIRYGGEPITVSTVGDVEGITLTVSDRGPGVSSADRQRIFERFVRLPHGREMNPEGSGLGLAIVAQAVSNHGGTIEVRDREEGGAEFVVNLPRRKE
jgi:signal transduction histidine kinase